MSTSSVEALVNNSFTGQEWFEERGELDMRDLAMCEAVMSLTEFELLDSEQQEIVMVFTLGLSSDKKQSILAPFSFDREGINQRLEMILDTAEILGADLTKRILKTALQVADSMGG